MILLLNTQRIVKLPTLTYRRDLAQLLTLAHYQDWDLGVRLAGNGVVRSLNRTYRGVNAATDILSFPFHQATTPGRLPTPQTDDERNLGDMVISVPYVQRWCYKHGEVLERRMPVLFCHGICHLLGYDHHTDEQYEEMKAKEEEILVEFWKWKEARGEGGK